MKIELRGTLRAAARLSARQWRGLAAASFLPFMLAAVVSTIQLWQMRDIYAAGLAANLTPTPDAEAQFEAAIQGRGLLFLGFFIFNALIVAWHFTRVVQFWKSGQAKPFGIQPGELHETSAVVAYALFVAVALFVTYVLALVALMLAGQGLALAGVRPDFLEALAGIAGLAVLVWLTGVAMRFFAGFPGIAQGGTPRPLRDLWPIAKGLTFGLGWRAIAVFVIFTVVSLLFMLIMMLPMIASSGGEIIDPDTRIMAPNAGQALAAVLAPAQIMAQALRTVAVAYFTTFLTLVFARLSGQDPLAKPTK